jgi:hypothetical protein
MQPKKRTFLLSLKLLTKLFQRYYPKYLLAICAIVGGYFTIYLIDYFSFHKHTTLCIFKLTTGLPCPGCGMGRASLELIKGNLISSWDYNILCIPFSIVVFISLFWLILDLAKRKETFFTFIKKDFGLKYKIVLIVLILIDWSVNIIRQI